MKTLCTFLLLLICRIAFAQNGTISGKIIDQKQQPLTGASVLLLQLPDSATINGQSTDLNGDFHFKNSKHGKYIVKIVMIGVITIYKSFDFSGSDLTLSPFIMVEKKNTLKEVTISSNIPQLEQKSDRLVVNVEKLNTSGDNALEVLKKAPGIRLDKDDNILYRNNGGVVVLIDGRRTYMSGAELSNYLKNMPGNALSKIELISNPPGNYDAEGTAGMINIILKHNKLQGYSGSANANLGYGKYGKAYGGFNFNYNSGKFSFFARSNTGYYSSYNKLTLSRQIGTDLYNQYNLWRPKTLATGYTIGTDFYAGKKSTFGVMFKGYNNPTDAQFTSMSNTLNNLGEQTAIVTSLNPQKTYTGTYSINLNYSLSLDTSGQKLSFDADYVHSASTNNENYTNNYYNGNGILNGNPVYLKSASPVDYNIKAIKADYILPLKNKLIFEAGLKSSFVNTHAVINFDSLKTAGYLLDPKRSNDFVYDENINAVYATLSKTFNPKLDVKVSLRTEQTVSTANSISRNEVVKRNYLQFFPSAFLTYKVDSDNQLNASFSRRISRPGYSSLNSAIRYTDPYTAIQGNPYLQPSVSQSYVLNYTYKSFQILSLSYLKVNGDQNTVINQNDQTKESIATYQNLGSAHSLSATSSGTFNIKKWWNINAEIDASFIKVNTLVGENPFESSRFAWDANLDQTFFLPKNFKFQLTGSYNSPSIDGLARILSSSQIDAGITKTMLDKKLSVSFKVRDIFFQSRYRSILQYNNVNTRWDNEYESRRFTLGLTYNFGNTKLKTARNRQNGSKEEEGRM